MLNISGMIDMALLKFATVLVSALAIGNAAAATCVPAEDFNKFLERYQTDPSFQRQRAAQRLAMTDLAGREDREATREYVTRGWFLKRAYGPFPGKAWIAQEKLEMTIETLSPDKAQAHIFAPSSDSFSRYYVFSRIHGCWRLTEFRRDSL